MRTHWITKLIAPRLQLCSVLDCDTEPQLKQLDSQLRAFYNSTFAQQYFESAESKNILWTPKMRGHWHLKHAIPKGSRVIDLGCGTAHPCRNMADRDIKYTGVDWSEEQIAQNIKLMPGQTFMALSLYDASLPNESFDAAISLHVIEHMVWPNRLLD